MTLKYTFIYNEKISIHEICNSHLSNAVPEWEKVCCLAVPLVQRKKKLRDWITACSCHAPTEAILQFALSLLFSGAECCYTQWLQWPAQVTLLDLLGSCRGVTFLLPGSPFKLCVMLCRENFMNVHFCSLSFIIGLRILCWPSSFYFLATFCLFVVEPKRSQKPFVIMVFYFKLSLAICFVLWFVYILLVKHVFAYILL